MPNDSLLKIFQKSYQNTDLTPLFRPDQLKKFWVEYGSDAVRQMVLHSGGVLRELMRISNRSCRICLREIRRNPEQTGLKINSVVLDEAIKDLRLDFETTLGKTDYTILKETYEKFLPEDPKEQAFLDLLQGLDVLEYRNNEVWYNVHPIVMDLLQRKGLINASS